MFGLSLPGEEQGYTGWVKVHLAAVQARMRSEPYRTPEAFAEWIVGLTERAAQGLDDAPKLVAFPEIIGMPLLLTLSQGGGSSPTRLSSVALTLLKREWRAVLRAAVQHRAFGPQAFFLARALPAYRAYTDAFSEAARLTGATIVAGTSFLPAVSDEAARGLHITSSRVENAAYTFAPTGNILGRSAKRFLTAGLESRVGLSRGKGATNVLETPAGRVGVAVCLDGFYSTVLDTLDGLGAQVVVQPSANFAPWARRWPPDGAYSEGEAWLTFGLRRGVRDRQNVRYGVNPMLVGELFGLRAEGRSSIVANPRFLEAETEGYGGVVALAGSSDQEAIVRVTVPL